MSVLRKIYTRYVKHLFPREFQVYCVGAPKTGSTSLWSMFSYSFRATHEPDVAGTNPLVISWLDNKVGRLELEKALRERDRNLGLELESSHLLGYVSDVIADIFADAKFLITIREPYSWLESRLNFHYKVESTRMETLSGFFLGKKSSRICSRRICAQGAWIVFS